MRRIGYRRQRITENRCIAGPNLPILIFGDLSIPNLRSPPTLLSNFFGRYIPVTTYIMAHGLSVAARLWRILTRVLETPTTPRAPAVNILPGIPSAGIKIPEEGANNDYELFCGVTIDDQFNDERYIALRKLGYGQYSTVWLARDAR
jgi:hypothetical protein